MDWNSGINGFKHYLVLERSLSPNTVHAYIRDVEKLRDWCLIHKPELNPIQLMSNDISEFVQFFARMGLKLRSQARIISGIKAFYKYLLIEDALDHDPTELIEGPKLDQKIPDTLNVEEINTIFEFIDHSDPVLGHRNRAIIETLYACGLRVSELVNLRLTHYFPEAGFLRVIGKNNKERIVPIGSSAIEQNQLYLDHSRSKIKVKEGHEDFLFLNRRGRQLSRVMIFNIIKKSIADAGIRKNVSPHTFRHSFATHLVEGGADLRAVQEMLGHESILTTEIYTHLDTRFLRDTIEKFHPLS